MLLLEITTFTIVLWLGFYVISRDSQNRLLLFTGIGIISYALSLALGLIATLEGAPPSLVQFQWGSLLLPPLFWAGAAVHLAPKNPDRGNRLYSIWKYGLAPATGITFALFVFTPLFWDAGNLEPTGLGLSLLVTANLLPSIATLCVARDAWQNRSVRKGTGAALTAVIFFTLGIGLILFPLDWLPRFWVLVAVAFDFEILGFAIIWLDAFELGENAALDFAKSFAYGIILSILFGGQIGFIIMLATGVMFPIVVILHLTITVALLIATFSEPLQRFIEKIVFIRRPILQASQAALRTTARAQTRLNESLDPINLDIDQFTRLTRRALSNFGDLPKLSASPLTNLQIVQRRLNGSGDANNTLEKARVLKTILTESIERLKPAGNAGFGDTDEWRFYNALYFPYVAGLRPYSRRMIQDQSEPHHRQALDWLRTTVPERTLYNWQNAAARLIAQDLKEQETNG